MSGLSVPGLTARQCRTLRRQGDCIVKTTQVNEVGYAHVSVRRPDGTWTRAKAHRVVAIAAFGTPDDPRLSVDHICHVRNCVNPEHLRFADWVVQAKNRDPERRYAEADRERYRAERDRAIAAGRIVPGRRPKPETPEQAALTAAWLAEMRAKHGPDWLERGVRLRAHSP